MEKPSPQQNARTSALKHGEKSKEYKGIQMRKWGKWVSEVRIPKSRAKIWLGSYATAEQAARAYDAAMFCLRGPSWKFNFPNSIPDIPSASSLSHRQIQIAAAKHAAVQIPSICNWNESESVLTVELALPSSLSPVSQMEVSSESQIQSPWWESDMESFWGDLDDNFCLDWEKFPSFDMATTDVLSPIDAPGSVFLTSTDLWNL